MGVTIPIAVPLTPGAWVVAPIAVRTLRCLPFAGRKLKDKDLLRTGMLAFLP